MEVFVGMGGYAQEEVAEIDEGVEVVALG